MRIREVLVVLTIIMAVPSTVRAGQAVQDAIVNFGPAHPQPVPPANHRLDPDEVTINKGGTVTFVVNGGGHRITIYPVSSHTVRADIEADLCQGGPTVCNGPAGTANLQYLITDAKGDLVIDTQTNVEQPFINYQPGLLLTTGNAFLTSSPVPPAVTPPGHQVQYRFEKTGRYLIICGTRGHSLNDWMFGFVNVVGTDAQ